MSPCDCCASRYGVLVTQTAARLSLWSVQPNCLKFCLLMPSVLFHWRLRWIREFSEFSAPPSNSHRHTGEYLDWPGCRAPLRVFLSYVSEYSLHLLLNVLLSQLLRFMKGVECRWRCTRRHRSRIRSLSKKKFANFNEFSEIKKICINSYKNSLNARVGVAFQWNSLLI